MKYAGISCRLNVLNDRSSSSCIAPITGEGFAAGLSGGPATAVVASAANSAAPELTAQNNGIRRTNRGFFKGASLRKEKQLPSIQSVYVTADEHTNCLVGQVLVHPEESRGRRILLPCQYFDGPDR